MLPSAKKVLLITNAHGEQYRVAAKFFIKNIGPIGNDKKWLILEDFNQDKTITNRLKFYFKRGLLLDLILNILSRFFFYRSRVIYSYKQEFINFELNKTFGSQLPRYEIGTKVSNFKDFESYISNYKPDLVYVVGAPLIPKHIIELSPFWINLHIGKLPNYRGLKCIEWSILKNDKHGLVATIHELTPQLDAGSIIEEIKLDIELKDTDLVSIYSKLYLAGMKKIFDKEILKSLYNKKFVKKRLKSNLYYSVKFNDFYKFLLLKKVNFYNSSIMLIAHNPVQYHTPIYKILSTKLILFVHYLSDRGVRAFYSKEQGGYIKWDLDLLSGYESKFHKNFSHDSFSGFFCRVNPSIIYDIYLSPHKYIWVNGYNYFTLVIVRVMASIVKKQIIFRGETIPKKKPHNLISLLKFKLKKIYCQWFMLNTKYILSSCYLNRKAFEELELKKTFISLPSAVDSNFFTKYSDRNWIQKKHFLIKKIIFITVSRLTKRKKINRSIDILSYLKEKGLKTEFWVVGDGPEKENIKNYADKKNISLKLFGFCDQKKVSKLMGKAHFFIIMSDYDASPKALNEALAIGLPVFVSSTVGTCYDVIQENKNGLIINAEDKNFMNTLYKFVFKCVSNPKFYKSSCKKSLEIDKKFSLEKNIVNMVNVLKNG